MWPSPLPPTPPSPPLLPSPLSLPPPMLRSPFFGHLAPLFGILRLSGSSVKVGICLCLYLLCARESAQKGIRFVFSALCLA
jgi:hypothetical protein